MHLIEIPIFGARHAGLAIKYYLSARGIAHVLLSLPAHFRLLRLRETRTADHVNYRSCDALQDLAQVSRARPHRQGVKDRRRQPGQGGRVHVRRDLAPVDGDPKPILDDAIERAETVAENIPNPRILHRLRGRGPDQKAAPRGAGTVQIAIQRLRVERRKPFPQRPCRIERRAQRLDARIAIALQRPQ